MASTIARFRPKASIVALSASQALINSLVMVCGVAPLPVEQSDCQRAHMSRVLDFLRACSLARPGDHSIIVASSGDAIGMQDTLQVVTLPA
jgi:pyruvate kinase